MTRSKSNVNFYFSSDAVDFINGPWAWIMSKKMPLSDFRAVRVALEPADFALHSGEPGPPPSDLIMEKVWSGIMDLPDDVAVMTSSHNGKVLGEVYWIWGRWIEATGDGESPDELFAPMLDACDDLQTSTFNALHGYYRAAFSSLRNVLERMTYGAWKILCCDPEGKVGSHVEFKFGESCNQLSREPSLSEFNKRMRAGGQSLWDTKRGALPGGYVRRWYRDLCNYAHSRAGFTDGNLWESNGPIYVHKAFWDWYCAYLRTVSLCSILMFLARPHGDRRLFADLFTRDPDVIPADLMRARKLVANRTVITSLGRSSLRASHKLPAAVLPAPKN